MSTTWVTPSGLVKKTLPELKAEYEALFRASFGTTIDLRAEGPFGQIIGLLSKRDADLWDLIQEIYTSRDPSQASGISLDAICGETGVLRLDATPTVVDWVRITGLPGRTIPAGSKIRAPGSSLTFSLAGAVVIGSGICSDARLSVVANATHGLVLDSVIYSYTTLPGDTDEAIIDGVIALIEAGAFTGSVERIAGPMIRVFNDSGAFEVGQFGFSFEQVSSPGTFTADVDGSNAVAANTLTEIVTPIADWDSVTNPIVGTSGRNVETDAELRARRVSSARTGKATEQAILSALYSRVVDIVSASVTSNRTSIADGDGRPPKSFECVVEGGTEAAIAQTIWETMPAGIESYGNTSEVITDSQGFPQTIYFSRPEIMYLWISILRSLYSEETFPVDGDAQIEAAVLAWSLTEYSMGKDVITGRISIPIYTIPGISTIEVEVAVTPDPLDTPTYSTANISIGSREIAMADLTRITVGDL